MFVDGRSLPAGTALEADIAIVGAGAAGITLARALKDSGLSVALIESGGLEWSQEAQDLAAGELGPQTYATPDTVRLRYFGGTTGHWGGWCRELDAIDFEPRDFVPLSGWPLKKAEIDPWYAKAQGILQLGTPQRYADSEGIAKAAGATLPIVRDGDIEPILFEFSPPTRMGEVYRAEIEQSAVRTYLNTTVVDLRVSDDTAKVTTLTLARDGGPPLAMAVRHVVLATGALSNAQLLLAADSHVRGGLGNGSDQVGRYFTDHPILIGYAAILALDPSAGGPFAFGDIAADKRRWRLAFQPSETYRAAQKRLSCLITIEPPGPSFDPATGMFDRSDVKWFGAPETVNALAAANAAGPVRLHVLNAGIETRPNPDSRVTLTDKRDRFGMRRLKVDWRLRDEDLEHYLLNLADFAKALARSGAALLRIPPDAAARWPEETSWGHHNLGTTRMGDDPKISVCDKDGRVHGMANLWVAGSSLWTTPGAANPTLTIVALALRLADRLKAEMAT